MFYVKSDHFNTESLPFTGNEQIELKSIIGLLTVLLETGKIEVAHPRAGRVLAGDAGERL